MNSINNRRKTNGISSRTKTRVVLVEQEVLQEDREVEDERIILQVRGTTNICPKTRTSISRRGIDEY